MIGKRFLAAAIVAGSAFCLHAQVPTSIPQIRFNAGQNVAPYFEGWIRNTDGSFDLVFGYFNRNYQEELVIPPGPDNKVEPGPPDQGQPTYFMPRRQRWTFRIRVPADFGKKSITWTVTAHGRTDKAYGELIPVQEITERIVMTNGGLDPGDDDPNAPPSITIAPITNAVAGTAVPLVASVMDDGLPKPRVPVAPRPAAPTAGQSTFGAQQDIVGRSIEIDGARHEVIGIMPAGFDLMDKHVELWMPLQLAPALRQKGSIKKDNKQCARGRPEER